MSDADLLFNTISILAALSLVTLPAGAASAIAFAIRIIPRSMPASACRRCAYERAGLGSTDLCPECGLTPRKALEVIPLRPPVRDYWPATLPFLTPFVFASFVFAGSSASVLAVFVVLFVVCLATLTSQLLRASPHLSASERSLLFRASAFPAAITLFISFAIFLSDSSIRWTFEDFLLPIAAAGGILGLAVIVAAWLTLSQSCRRKPLDS